MFKITKINFLNESPNNKRVLKLGRLGCHNNYKSKSVKFTQVIYLRVCNKKKL